MQTQVNGTYNTYPQKQAVPNPAIKNSEGFFSKYKYSIIGGLTAAAGITALILTRGKSNVKTAPAQEKAIESLIKQGKLDKNYVDIFKKVSHLEGKKFASASYNEIAKEMGYSQNGRPMFKFTDATTSKFNFNSISINPNTKIGDITKPLEKTSLFNVVRHELEHFKQEEMMYHAFGKEKLIDAKINCTLKNMELFDEFSIRKVGKPYNQLNAKELSNFKDKTKNALLNKDWSLYENILKEKGVIKKGTAEYQYAQNSLNGTNDYVALSSVAEGKTVKEGVDIAKKMEKDEPEKFKKIADGYFNNFLEINAIKEGDSKGEMLRLFLETIGKK